jgi:hypothetical protein
LEIDWREWRWALAVSLIALAFSSLPYAAGFLTSSPDVTFGGAVVNVEDFNTYLAKMQLGARGEWRTRLLFTPEPHRGIFLSPYYVALGHVARWTRLSLAATYHLARLVFGMLLLLVVYAFIGLFVRRRAVRRVAFLLAAFSSGLGWLVTLVAPAGAGSISPIDFWLMDAYVFFSLLTFPHFCLSVTSLLGVFGGTVGYLRRPRPALLGLIAISALLLALLHSFIAIVVDVALLAYSGLLWRLRRRVPWQAAWPMSLAGLLPLPLIVYQYTSVKSNPVFRGFQAQNVTASPPPGYYLLGYGLVLLLALAGAWRAIRRHDERRLFLVVWLVTVAVLVYAPLSLQRRMVEGAHVALCILAADGLVGWLLPAIRRSSLARLAERRLRYPPQRLRSLALNLILALSGLSNVYLVAGLTVAAAARHPLLFHPREQNEALAWLAAHSAPDDTILAGFAAGNYIPARIGHRVFLGHVIETIDYRDKTRLAHDFFAGEMSDDAARRLLRDYGIAYVYIGPGERATGDFDPASKPYLARRFATGNVAVYQVVGD